jgi:hypothetical protein
MRPRRLDDLREADHGDDVVGADGAAVDLFEELDLVLEPAKLRVVVLDVARREIADLLHLDVVDHRGEDFLARAVTETDGNPDHLATLVLAGLVAEPDRRRLATSLELVDENRGVEVEHVDPAAHGGASVSDGGVSGPPHTQREPGRAGLTRRWTPVPLPWTFVRSEV